MARGSYTLRRIVEYCAFCTDSLCTCDEVVKTSLCTIFVVSPALYIKVQESVGSNRSPQMHLYLTKFSHLNSSYVNDNGQVLYKVKTPFKLLSIGMVTTITTILPEDIRTPSSSGTSDNLYDTISDNDVKGDVEFDGVPRDDVDEKEDQIDSEKIELRDRFAHLAEIKFKMITSSVMRYRGEELKTSEFFTKKEWGYYDRYAPLYIEWEHHSNSSDLVKSSCVHWSRRSRISVDFRIQSP